MDRFFLEFETSDPGETEVAVGRSVLAEIAGHLRRQGLTIAEDVVPWESYGWTFTVRRNDALVECMIQRSDAWLLTCWAHGGFLDRLLGRSVTAELNHVLAEIAQAVGHATGRSDLRWRTAEEFRRDA